mmetsp:Transcript_183/g.274  ORF Transcript_183/g.274 Transcript_183/m.274 type:complete len:401 (-) Transcript_183:564-1766(-)|eukprot:CAMPEP_0184865730 /NCGR_PEP_ID=MMETSP0580-20130426/18822_1 /TAXON_ID=1118495 /ORGANISM="Dactyliosolen fragilissimus" /LENGTH=400 /DNA_ID=CAMNT_0027365031 /DNA_START=77 /DNA_END=1282 /DNA_ORIENTATION=+
MNDFGSLDGADIANILQSKGPIVQCVLLRAEKTLNNSNRINTREDDSTAGSTSGKKSHDKSSKDDKDDPSSFASLNEDDECNKDLVSQISLDTTPKKSMVSTILGGPFTFLGQYEEEGIMLMIRRPTAEANQEEQKDETGAPPENLKLNPHKLQPPFHKSIVHGDILIVKVAAQNEDESGNDQSDASDPQSPPGETGEFFLDYTKEEYLKFAARTDILPNDKLFDRSENITDTKFDEQDESNSIQDDNENAEEGDDDDDDDDDGDYEIGESDLEDDDDEESDQVAMMNLILSQILKKFRQENGRGPDTQELLLMKSALAERLGIDCSTSITDGTGEEVSEDAIPTEESCASIKDVKKRQTVDSEETDESQLSRKRVKFDLDDESAQNNLLESEDKENIET